MKRKRDHDSTHWTQHDHHHSTRPPPPPRQPSSPSIQPSHWTIWHCPTSRWTPLDTSTFPTHSVLSPSSPTSSSSPTSLSFLTYNTFSSSPSHTPLQSRTLLSLLHTSSAHVISLQEVSLPFFRLLASLPWVRANYALTTPEAFWAIAGEGGKGPKSKEGAREAVVVMVRKELVGRGSEVGFVKLPKAKDEQGKAGIVVKLHSGGKEQLRIFTSHFTSLPENASIRSAQYRIAHSILAAVPSSPHPHLILLGDFNASSEAEFAPLLAPIATSTSSPNPTRLVDACPLPPPSSSSSRKRPHPSSSSSSSAEGEAETERRFRHRPSFGHLYPYVTLHSRKPRKPRRIDRVYLSSPSSSSSGGGGLKVKKYEEVGTDPLRDEQGNWMRDRLGKEGRAWASDHVGVRVEVEWQWEGEGEGEGEEDEEEEGEEDGGEEEEEQPAKKKRRRGKKKKRGKEEGG